MDHLVLAKRRAHGRRRSAGAAIFIVAMTLAVLVSVGIYALAASANESRSSGNERQSTQTHYLAEYGIVGAAHELTSSRAQFILGEMMTTKYQDTNCLSLPTPPTAYKNNAQMLACRRMGSAELGSTWTGAITVPYSGSAPYASNLPGSLGPVPMTADFFVEVTEPTQANAPAKYALDLHFCFVELTVSSTGITQPIVTGATALTTEFGAEGLETERARIIAGPVQCPK